MIKTGIFPNARYGSDHIPLGAKFSVSRPNQSL
jgi:mRNA deadenylase 3'-5' endonuclease subunit Ccr4